MRYHQSVCAHVILRMDIDYNTNFKMCIFSCNLTKSLPIRPVLLLILAYVLKLIAYQEKEDVKTMTYNLINSGYWTWDIRQGVSVDLFLDMDANAWDEITDVPWLHVSGVLHTPSLNQTTHTPL